MRYNILIIDYRDITHPEAGGAELILYEIFKRIGREGCRISFLCGHYKGAKHIDQVDGFRIFRVGNQYNFNFLVPSYYKKILLHERFDIIIEDIDKIPFFMPFFVKDIPVIPWIPHLFGTTVYQQASFPLATYVYLYERVIPYIYQNCQVAVLSDSTKNDLAKRGISEKNIYVIHPGIDHTLYWKATERVQNCSVILYLGRIKKYKCIEHIIYAMPEILKEVPFAKYYVVGDGDYLPVLKRIVKRMSLEDNVKFLGVYQGKKKVKLIQESKLLAYTSPKEGWGMSVIEANACGVPVIASDSPGLRDSVIDGKTGFLVKHGDIKTLANRIIRILKDEGIRKKLSENAIEWASRFSWDTAAREMLSLLQDVVNKKNPAASYSPVSLPTQYH